jgi:hypothetical protein
LPQYNNEKLVNMRFHPDTATFTREQIADWYNIDRRTLLRWFNEAGLEFPRRRLNPRDLELIFDAFGHPETVKQLNREALRVSVAGGGLTQTC